MSRYGNVTLCLILAVAVVSAQNRTPATLQVSGEHLVAGDPNGHPMVEPTLAIDPADQRHWVVAAIVAAPDLKSSDCTTLASFDAGRTWNRFNLHVTDCFDPWLRFVGGNEIVLAVLQDAATLRLFRSSDGGRSWLSLPPTAAGVDHETLTSSRPRTGAAEVVYVLGEQELREPASGNDATSVMLMQLTDRMRSVHTKNVFPSLLSLNAMNPVLLEDGTLLVPYTDFARPTSSDDAPLQHPRSWLLRSSDGQTFSPPILISESCFRSWEWISLDDSKTSPFHGRLYYVCNGTDYHSVLLHRSIDGGRTWDGPVLAGSSATNANQRIPEMAVNRDGNVGISWYQWDDSKQSSNCMKLVFSASFDGGLTFSTPLEVSSAPSCPDPAKNGEAGKRWPAGGDYSGLEATSDGVFHIVWSDGRNGAYQLWTADVKSVK